MIVDYTNHIVLTGNIYINAHGLTTEQEEYNQYAPILMTSVDTNPKLCAKKEMPLFKDLLLEIGKYSARTDLKRLFS